MPLSARAATSCPFRRARAWASRSAMPFAAASSLRRACVMLYRQEGSDTLMPTTHSRRWTLGKADGARERYGDTSHVKQPGERLPRVAEIDAAARQRRVPARLAALRHHLEGAA